jgi:hypothetical protein
MNLPDDDRKWSKHGAVIIRSDANCDNWGGEKDYIKMGFMVCLNVVHPIVLL